MNVCDYTSQHMDRYKDTFAKQLRKNKSKDEIYIGCGVLMICLLMGLLNGSDQLFSVSYRTLMVSCKRS